MDRALITLDKRTIWHDNQQLISNGNVATSTIKKKLGKREDDLDLFSVCLQIESFNESTTIIIQGLHSSMHLAQAAVWL